MAEARTDQERDGVTEMSRIVSKPQPVAYLSLQIILTIDYYIQVIMSFAVTTLFLYKIYLYSYPLMWAYAEFGLFFVL